MIAVLNQIKSNLLDNKTTKQTVAKNTFWLTVSLVVSKVIKYSLIIYAARFLGASEYGTFNFSMSFVALFAIFADLGINTLTSREVAKEKEVKVKIPTIFTLKIAISIATFIGIAAVSFLVPQTEKIKTVIWLMAGFSLVNGISNFLYNCFYGRQEMQYQTITEIVEALVCTVLGIYFISLNPHAYSLAIAYVISALSGFVVIALIFKHKFGDILKPTVDKKEWQRVLTMAWPLALSGIFATIYTNTDSIILGFWKLFTQVGYYNAAQKIIALAVVPAGLVATAFFPILSRHSENDKPKTQKIFDYQNIILLAIAIPMIVGGFILANGMIIHIYGEAYLPAVLALKILILMAGMSYLATAFGNILLVYNQQKNAFWAYFWGAMINVPLDILWIGKWGFYGAAWATVVTSFLSITILAYFVRKHTPLKLVDWSLTKYLIAILISSALMGFVLLNLASHNVNVILKVILGILVYSICISVFYCIFNHKNTLIFEKEV